MSTAVVPVPRAWRPVVAPGLEGIDVRRARAVMVASAMPFGPPLVTIVHIRPTRSGALGWMAYAMPNGGVRELVRYRDDRSGD